MDLSQTGSKATQLRSSSARYHLACLSHQDMQVGPPSLPSST